MGNRTPCAVTARRRLHAARALAALVALALLQACTVASRAPASAPPLSFQLVESHWESQRCSARTGCARVLHRQPRFGDDVPAELRDALERWVDARLAEGVDGGEADDTPARAARRFVDAFERETRGLPSPGPEWTDERRIDVLHENARLVSLVADRVSYTGGAHPMQYRTLASFDRADPRPLGLADVLREGTDTLLEDLLTRELRRSRDVPAGTDLVDAGFFLDANRVPLTDNFAVTGEGLRFRYDPYEIAPYAMGPVELELDFDTVGSLLRSDGPAAPPQRPPVMRD